MLRLVLCGAIMHDANVFQGASGSRHEDHSAWGDVCLTDISVFAIFLCAQARAFNGVLRWIHWFSLMTERQIYGSRCCARADAASWSRLFHYLLTVLHA